MRTSHIQSLKEKFLSENRTHSIRLSPEGIILPYFVIEGDNVKNPIKSMPGVFHLSVDNIVKDIKDTQGLKAVLVFGVTDKKDESGKEGYSDDGVVQKAVRALKGEFPDLVVMTDVCLCGYTSHGHCGILRRQTSDVRPQIVIDNDETLKALSKIALSHAKSGADFVAPSAMMDNQVSAIREALDQNGLEDTGIMAYSAKYASSFYGPFREALGSAPKFGDRRSYQLDFKDTEKALWEIEQDIAEGADIVMVKPALAYLDIILRAKQKFNVPIAAYNVSGEYSMLKSADPDIQNALLIELLTGIKRAGADFVITYSAKEAIKG